MALRVRANEIAQVVLETWAARTSESYAEDERVRRDVLRFALSGNEHVAHFLITGESPTADQLRSLSLLGRAAADETVTLDDLTKASLYWRDAHLSFIHQEARRLGVPRAVISLAEAAVRAGSDSALVRMARQFELRRRELRAELAEEQDRLAHQALHDSLTGLPNRAMILAQIDQMLARARRTHIPTAALFLDLDDFKDINDTLGHIAGDQLLAEVGNRLAGAVRKGDTVGRLGGDEFVVLVEGASLAAGAEVVAERILDLFVTPFEIPNSDAPLTVTASIGVAAGDRAEPEELLRDADIALYRAKATGKHRAVIFSPSMQVVVDDHRNLAVDLHRALEASQFFLLYQPTVDFSTGSFTGVEALLRWRHPERGVVQPDDFIPALESSGLIVPVGQWVLEEACRQGARWHSLGHRITVSVNISTQQLERDRLVDDVHSALSVSGFDPGMLILELTERTLTNDVQATVARLNLLKAIGVRLAVDDFGTGHSSLAHLRQFPIDVLKIDRTFVSGIADTKEAAALVHTLIQLGKVLGLETIAEGVENNDQRLRLEAEKADSGQGFLFAKPLDIEAVDHLLAAAASNAEVSSAVT
jgi:diguanylate cyclase (GGDEF)-like protein